LPLALYKIDTEKSQLEVQFFFLINDYLKLKLFNNSTDDEEYLNDERQCLIKMFAVSLQTKQKRFSR
jgi:hypothetical protein